METLLRVTTTYGYGYGDAGRLESVTTNGLLTAEYVYDPNGNRLEKRTLAGSELGSYDDQDRMLTYGDASFAYTANGELLTKTDNAGTTSYDYDVFGNLLGVDLPNGTQIDYKVDARNRRIERRVNGAVTQRLLWQGQLSPVAELNASNTVVSRFVYATRVNVPDFMIRSGATYRVITDHLGSPRLIVNASTGAIAQRMSYDEWGVVTQDTNPGFQPFGFAGGVYDGATGLVRFGARDCNSTIGRWTARDPIIFDAGDANLWNYSAIDPVNRTDVGGLYSPLGHIAITYAAGLNAGLGVLESLTLALRTAAVDWQPTWSDSQAKENAHLHAMCGSGKDIADCIERFRERVEEGVLSECEPASLAQRLHALQDSFSPGHAGFAEYTGEFRDLPVSHVFGDWLPLFTNRPAAILASQQFISSSVSNQEGGW